ncbi:MAG TPA: excinuclease ABC subunit UvrC, partial [Thiothrix sp.]|nr:excinuclease ABC subunit UvrC [Thiothrix sp.]
MKKNSTDLSHDTEDTHVSNQTITSSLSSNFDGKAFANTLPHKPGVYRMIGANDEVLYVGKAKNLKHRVASYFTGNRVNPRIWSMVQQVQAIQITLTTTEAEALLLESNLIKQHKTRYNVLLRDGKGYPFLYLSTQDDYPRLSFYRGKRKPVGDYFGPYPSVGAVNEAMQHLQKLFLVRQCEDSYFANRSRPCLQYQIKRCSAPCTRMIDPAAYRQSVHYTKAFLQGKSEEVIQALVVEMEQAAAALAFEKAAQIRDQIEQLRHITQQQYIVNGQGNVDVIALHYGSGIASIQVFTIRRGYNLGNQNFFPQVPEIDINNADILAAFVAQYYLQRDVPSEIILSHGVPNLNVLQTMLSEKAERSIKLHCRVRAERQKWLDLASQNALFAWQAQLSSKAGMQKRLAALQALLHLPH